MTYNAQFLCLNYFCNERVFSVEFPILFDLPRGLPTRPFPFAFLPSSSPLTLVTIFHEWEDHGAPARSPHNWTISLSNNRNIKFWRKKNISDHTPKAFPVDFLDFVSSWHHVEPSCTMACRFFESTWWLDCVAQKTSYSQLLSLSSTTLFPILWYSPIAHWLYTRNLSDWQKKKEQEKKGRGVFLGLFSSNKNCRSPARAHSSTDNPSRDVRSQNLVPPAMISVISRIRLWFERGRDLECDHQSGVFWTTCNCLHNITNFYPPILKLCSLDRSWKIMGDMFELFGGLFSRSWERIRQTWWVFWCEKSDIAFLSDSREPEVLFQ